MPLRKLSALLLIIFFMGAAPLFLPELEETFFTGNELIILDETLDFLSLTRGYNREYDLNYITFSYFFNETIFIQRSGNISILFNNKDINILKSLHGKLYKLFLITKKIIGEHKKIETKEADFIEKNYLVPLKKYYELLGNYLDARDAGYKAVFSKEKRKIEQNIKLLYGINQGVEEPFFNRKEIRILKKTTNALDFDYGYDKEIGLAYIFSYSYSKKDFSEKEKNLNRIIDKLDIDMAENFYKKVFKLFAMTEHKIDKYKEKKQWKYYTYIKKDLYPALEEYLKILEKNISSKIPSFNETKIKEQNEIKKWVKWYYKSEEAIVDTF